MTLPPALHTIMGFISTLFLAASLATLTIYVRRQELNASKRVSLNVESLLRRVVGSG